MRGHPVASHAAVALGPQPSARCPTPLASELLPSGDGRQPEAPGAIGIHGAELLTLREARRPPGFRKTGHQQPIPSWGLQGRAGHEERVRGASPAPGFQDHPGSGPPTVVDIGAAGHWSAMSGRWSRAVLCYPSLAPGSPVLGHSIEGPGVPGGGVSTWALCPPGRHRGDPRLEGSSKGSGQVVLWRARTTGQERPRQRRGRHGRGAEVGMVME